MKYTFTLFVEQDFETLNLGVGMSLADCEMYVVIGPWAFGVRFGA